MTAVGLTTLASLLFTAMGVCIKFASEYHGSGEIVMVRGVVGAVLIAGVSWWQGESLRTRVPWRHVSRSITSVASLTLWFQSIAVLPLATAVTLNYTSSLWLAVALAVSALLARGQRVEPRLLWAIVLGFVGVVMMLQPTMRADALWFGVMGLMSGLLSALGYLQVAALGRLGETAVHAVFYFSLCCAFGGAAKTAAGGWTALPCPGLGWLLAVGVLGTVARLLLTRAYARGSPLVTASLQCAGIAFSFVAGVVIFDDAVSGLALAGIALIVGAAIRVTQLRQAKANAARS